MATASSAQNAGRAVDQCHLETACLVIVSRTGVGSRATGRLPALMMATISSTSCFVKLPVMRPESVILLMRVGACHPPSPRSSRIAGRRILGQQFVKFSDQSGYCIDFTQIIVHKVNWAFTRNIDEEVIPEVIVCNGEASWTNKYVE